MESAERNICLRWMVEPVPSVTQGCPDVPQPLAEPWGRPHPVMLRARQNPCSRSAGRPQEKGLSGAHAGSPARSALSLRRGEGSARLGPYPTLSLLQEAWSPGARPRDFLDSVIRYRSSFLFRVRGWRSGVKPSLLLPSWWVLHCTQVCGCCRCVPPRLDAVGMRRSSVVAPWPA